MMRAVSLTSLRMVTLAMVLPAAAACSSPDNAPGVARPAVTVPERAAIGGLVEVTYRFDIPTTAPAFDHDYTVFVHAVNEGGTRVWTADHQPPRPTKSWRPGSVVEYTRPMRVPRSAKPGRITLQLGLYEPGTGDRLPLSGDSADRRAYRVARLDVQLAPPGQPDVLFAEGWHGIEVPGDTQALEWRWSKREATVLLRNPKRDSVVLMELDQPIPLERRQTVHVVIGSEVVDTFEPTAQIVARRIPVSAATLGAEDFAQLTLRVDHSFVPARLPRAMSTDTRELGVRVFSVDISPAPEDAAGDEARGAR